MQGRTGRGIAYASSAVRVGDRIDSTDAPIPDEPSRTVRHVIAESAYVWHSCTGRHGVKVMKAWLLDRALLILAAVGFVAAVLVSSRWLGNENLYSAITAITIVA